MKRVAILGLGLMGGSLGLALKARGVRVAGYARRAPVRDQALEMEAVDEAFSDPARAVEGASVVVVCVPVLSTAALLKSCRAHLAPGALVTDVGSTKAEIVRAARAILRRSSATFLGSHPIAGSEQQGLAAARADLYERAVVVLTPVGGEPSGAAKRLERFWTSVGARTVRLPPRTHDRIMARTSHLPHLVAAALSVAVGRSPQPPGLRDFCGTGFRDTTRIAEGAPDIWMDILQSNRKAIAMEVRAFERQVGLVARWLETGRDASLRAFLEQGRADRKALAARHTGAVSRGRK